MPGTASTSCWISIRAWARSSGCSGMRTVWTSCSRRTWTSPARRCPRAPSWTAALPRRELRPDRRVPLLAEWRTAAGSWLASLRPVNELAWFATDDLRPFGLMCARMAARGITRRFRRPAPSRALGGQPRYRAGRANGHLANPAGPGRAPGELPAIGNTLTWPGHGRRRAHDKGGTSMNARRGSDRGSGPYGLSLASHLRAAGVSFRQFGQLMNPWRDGHAAGHVP